MTHNNTKCYNVYRKPTTTKDIMKNSIEFNYDQIHDFIEKNKINGFFWDGYDVIKWSPGHGGFTQVNGMYRNNKWGYANRYSMNRKGTWFIPVKYVSNT